MYELGDIIGCGGLDVGMHGCGAQYVVLSFAWWNISALIGCDV